jgi:hypothetical protein
MRPLLRDPALIDHENRIFVATEHSVRIERDLVHHRSRIPRCVRYEVLEALLVGVWNGFFHTLHVAAIRLQQSDQIVTCRKLA